jgi:hypothetical protein
MPDPNVRDLLLGKVDGITARMGRAPRQVKRVTAVGRSDVGVAGGRGDVGAVAPRFGRAGLLRVICRPQRVEAGITQMTIGPPL